MTAKDYLNERQRLFRRYEYLIRILQDRWKAGSLPPLEGEGELDRLLEGLDRQNMSSGIDAVYEEGYARRAHELFMSRVSEEGRERLSSYDLAVGELDTANFNASTLPVPDESNAYALAFTRGLSALVYEVARAIVASTNVASVDASPEGAGLSAELAAAHLHERLNYFFHLGVPFGSSYDISKHHMLVASAVTTMAERFVYCHEVSHVLLGHLDKATRAVVADEFGLEEVVNAHEREFESDLLGWQLLSNLLATSPSDLQLAVAGASLFLRIQHLFEEAKDTVAARTHPRAQDRLEALRLAIEAQAHEDGLPLEKVFEIEQGITTRFEQLLANVPSLPGESPLETLLSQAAATAVPDYWSFYGEIFSLMSHSGPNKLCKALGRSLAESETTLRRLGLNIRQASGEPLDPSIDSDSIRLAFSRLKLVSGAVQHFPSDIRVRIERFRAEWDQGA